MARFARFWLCLGAFAILLSLPDGASAGWLLGRGAGGSSYSPLHYWIPSLYTYRAYHHPVNYMDVAEYDLGEADAVPVENHSIGNPELLPPPKKEAEKK
jgi:hypothetical protein